MTAKNGQLPASQLVSVGICDLWWGTAHAFQEAQAAASDAGIGLAPINKYSGYRDLEVQADMHEHPNDPKFDNAPGVSVAPARSSTHGLGTAVDVISGFAWMKAHGSSYGFRRSIPGDTYHFQHDGKTAIGTNPASVGKVTPLFPPEETMDLAIVHTTGGAYEAHVIYSGGTYSPALGTKTLAAFRLGKKKGDGPFRELAYTASQWSYMTKYVLTPKAF